MLTLTVISGPFSRHSKPMPVPCHQPAFEHSDSRISERMVNMPSHLGIEIQVTDIFMLGQLKTTSNRDAHLHCSKKVWVNVSTSGIQAQRMSLKQDLNIYSSLVRSHLKTNRHLTELQIE